MKKPLSSKGISHLYSSIKTRISRVFYKKDHSIDGHNNLRRSAFEPRKRNKPSFYTRYLDANTPDGFSVVLVIFCLLIAAPTVYTGIQNNDRLEKRGRFINFIIKDKTKDYPWLDKEIDPNDLDEDDPTETDKDEELKDKSQSDSQS